MTSTQNPLQNFILTPQQQTLLFAALTSNQQTADGANGLVNLSPSSYNDSPLQRDGLNGFQDSPLIDDYSFGPDSSFDFTYGNGAEGKMIGDLPGGPRDDGSRSDSSDHDSPEKRSHPDDGSDAGDNKRRESEGKVAKKPGRKPLTSEPTTKRKAQNRAAQRAFRERKEKHLKDLETKVEELEKASEDVNHENSRLRAQVDRMTVELNEYKKRVAGLTSGSSPSTQKQSPSRLFGQSVFSNINDVNFQFEFPRFGVLPGVPTTNSTEKSSKSPSASISPAAQRQNSDQISPRGTPALTMTRTNSTSYSQIGLDSPAKDDLAVFSAGIYNPVLASKNAANASRTSFDSHISMMAPTATSSPSASSTSNAGPSSSCGTSPEPFTQSPMGFKPVDTLTTIGEEQPATTTQSQDNGQFASININDISWLASQNNFQFDPQLFGNYREPQENILSSGGVDDSFFNDAVNWDFATPYNMGPTSPAPKKDLIAQIDAAKEAEPEMVGPDGQLLTCNKIWEKLQNCPKVQSGDFDLDGLCSELQSKAKCSGSGPVVGETDFKHVMKKYLQQTDKDFELCAAKSVLGTDNKDDSDKKALETTEKTQVSAHAR